MRENAVDSLRCGPARFVTIGMTGQLLVRHHFVLEEDGDWRRGNSRRQDASPCAGESEKRVSVRHGPA